MSPDCNGSRNPAHHRCQRCSCLGGPTSDATSQCQPQRETLSSTLPQDDSDEEEWEEGFLEAHEELWPLKEALERAIMRKTEAIAQKEALEAKVRT